MVGSKHANQTLLQRAIEDSIIGKELDGQALPWNDFARWLYGHEPAEVVGKANSSIAHSAEDDARNPRKARSVDRKNSHLQRRGNMNQSKSFEPALISVFLSIALTLMLVCSSWAQSPAMRRVGVLTSGGRSLTPVLEGLRQGLAQLGYVEGKQITFIIEDTKMEALDPVKAVMRLLETKPDLIVTVSTSQTVAAKQVAGNLPIVFTVVADPVRLSLVASYASSKNNLTGVATDTASLSGKRLELLKEMFPSVRRALVVVSTKESAAQISFRFLEETAKKLDIQLIRRDVATKAELEKALLDSPKGSVDAIIHVPSNLLRNYINLLIDKATKDKLPLSVHEESMVREGALVSYGNDFRLIGVQAAKIVVKILKGVQPSEIPIETPEHPVLVVNRTTAKTIGFKIPSAFLEQVDRIVE